MKRLMRTRLVVSCCFAFIVASTGVAQAPAGGPRGLSVRLSKFNVVNKSFDDVLRELAVQSRSNLVIGFEPAISPEGRVPMIRVAMESGTAGDALALMCAADKRYVYFEVRPGVVEVRAVQQPPAASALMDLPVPSAEISVHDWPFNLFGRIQDLLPTLDEYLRMKAAGWSAQTGRPVPGSPGITMMASVPPPLIAIHLENTTVRGVLEALAEYTLTHGSKNRAYDPYLPPVGWRLDFTTNPQAPTGLGGYAKWSAFP